MHSLLRLKKTLDGMSILPIHTLLTFIFKLWLPIAVWGLVSLISGLCQTSVHSVSISNTDSLWISMSASDLTFVLQKNNMYKNQGRGLYNPQMAQSIIQGKSFQSDGFFYRNGLICSGKYNSTLEYESLCIKDSTECKDIDYNVGIGYGIGGSTKLVANLYPKSLPLKMIKTSNLSILDAGVVIWSLDSDDQTTGYFVGLSGSSVGSLSTSINESFAHNYSGYLSATLANSTFTTWAGICQHSISICPSFINQGKIRTTSCKSLELPFIDTMIPLPLQKHFTFRSALSSLSLNQRSKEKLMSKTLGLLFFAWTLSSFDTSHIPITSRFALNVETSTQPGIAMDLISTLLVILIFSSSSFLLLVVFTWSRKEESKILTCLNRIHWHPIYYLARELSLKYNLDFENGYYEDSRFVNKL